MHFTWEIKFHRYWVRRARYRLIPLCLSFQADEVHFSPDDVQELLGRINLLKNRMEQL